MLRCIVSLLHHILYLVIGLFILIIVSFLVALIVGTIGLAIKHITLSLLLNIIWIVVLIMISHDIGRLVVNRARDWFDQVLH